MQLNNLLVIFYLKGGVHNGNNLMFYYGTFHFTARYAACIYTYETTSSFSFYQTNYNNNIIHFFSLSNWRTDILFFKYKNTMDTIPQHNHMWFYLSLNFTYIVLAICQCLFSYMCCFFLSWQYSKSNGYFTMSNK